MSSRLQIPTFLLSLLCCCVSWQGRVMGQARVGGGGSSAGPSRVQSKDFSGSSKSDSKGAGGNDSKSGPSGPSRPATNGPTGGPGNGYRASPTPAPSTPQPHVRNLNSKSNNTTNSAGAGATPIQPGFSNSSSSSGNNSSRWGLEQQQDRRLQALEERFRLEDLLNNARARDARLRGMGMAPPVAIPVNRSVGGNFSIRFGGGKVKGNTADDGTEDGLADEVFVCLLYGFYDKTANFFAFLPPVKSRQLTNMSDGKSIPASAIDDKPLALYLEPGRHVVAVIPSIWEVDADDETQDRCSRLHDLIDACTSDIHVELSGLGNKANGLKQGQNLGFPSVGGTVGGNRPIGMTRAASGALIYNPKVLLLDFEEALQIAKGKGRQLIEFRDQAATELGGSYEVSIDITSVR